MLKENIRKGAMQRIDSFNDLNEVQILIMRSIQVAFKLNMHGCKK